MAPTGHGECRCGTGRIREQLTSCSPPVLPRPGPDRPPHGPVACQVGIGSWCGVNAPVRYGSRNVERKVRTAPNTQWRPTTASTLRASHPSYTADPPATAARGGSEPGYAEGSMGHNALPRGVPSTAREANANRSGILVHGAGLGRCAFLRAGQRATCKAEKAASSIRIVTTTWHHV